MKMTTENLLIEALKMANDSNSEFCAREAFHRYKNDHDDLARNWALKSLAYSVGINHPIYVQNYTGILQDIK